jgi:putative component of toxin-antitoxin plasmid stabilization module
LDVLLQKNLKEAEIKSKIFVFFEELQIGNFGDISCKYGLIFLKKYDVNDDIKEKGFFSIN